MKARHCDREAIRADRKVVLKMYGANFDAIVAVEGRNGWLSKTKRGRRDDGAFEMKKSDWVILLHHVTISLP